MNTNIAIPTRNNGKIYQSELTDASSLAEVEAHIPAAELELLDALGDLRDDARWKAGDMARLWIDERGLPQAQCLMIIARRTDWGIESIRKFLYCSRYYYEHADLRDKYSLLRHSIFDHARGCAEPDKVLAAAFGERLTPSVVKNVYPSLMDELKETYTKIPKSKMDKARSILEKALMELRKLTQ
jgi:hypothetical protein